jgi:hypothetical protein
MGTQLGLFSDSPPLPPSGLPPPVQDILYAARSITTFAAARGVGPACIARGTWGIGVAPNYKWMLVSHCCCPIGAYLVIKGLVADKETRGLSAIPSAAKALGITESQVASFLAGFDGVVANDGSEWFGYGVRVAKELGLE